MIKQERAVGILINRFQNKVCNRFNDGKDFYLFVGQGQWKAKVKAGCINTARAYAARMSKLTPKVIGLSYIYDGVRYLVKYECGVVLKTYMKHLENTNFTTQ